MRTPNERLSFNDFVKLHGKKQLRKSVRQAHDLILYDSDLQIDKKRKEILHDLKLLADQINKI